MGRAQPKNWILWLSHIKWRFWKKVERIQCWWYKDWWQSYGGRSRGTGPAGGKWFWSVLKKTKKKKTPAASRQLEGNGFEHFWQKKKGACGKPPAGGKWFWAFLIQKKAPAATGQSEENGSSQKNIRSYPILPYPIGTSEAARSAFYIFPLR